MEKMVGEDWEIWLMVWFLCVFYYYEFWDEIGKDTETEEVGVV